MLVLGFSLPFRSWGGISSFLWCFCLLTFPTFFHLEIYQLLFLVVVDDREAARHELRAVALKINFFDAQSIDRGHWRFCNGLQTGTGKVNHARYYSTFGNI
jgi:hypothetical protein